MLETLNGKLGRVKEASEEAFKSIGELEQSVNDGNAWSQTQKDLLRAHREQLERLQAEIKFFRSENENQIPSGSESNA